MPDSIFDAKPLATSLTSLEELARVTGSAAVARAATRDRKARQRRFENEQMQRHIRHLEWEHEQSIRAALGQPAAVEHERQFREFLRKAKAAGADILYDDGGVAA